MKEIQVSNVRAVLKCLQCGETQISVKHANADYMSSVLVRCEGECNGHNHHRVIAKRMTVEELDPEPEKPKSIPPMIVDESVREGKGMADELVDKDNIEGE